MAVTICRACSPSMPSFRLNPTAARRSLRPHRHLLLRSTGQSGRMWSGVVSGRRTSRAPRSSVRVQAVQACLCVGAGQRDVTGCYSGAKRVERLAGLAARYTAHACTVSCTCGGVVRAAAQADPQ
ncbi:hypothetical protein FA95DRAFT_1033512 [Auriscalpium vulgare]|uniref:Uncharacterized protein n=1 Tax=Auriscalpium vulgare TaxID=40419 RepID=A0ACB8RX31_9AGAM|nr:hypothetical protein FA95DRAFT_1033512 [Auriscalpium vulgare]